MAVTKETKKTKQSLILSEIKDFEAEIANQPGTEVPLTQLNSFLARLKELAKLQAKALSLAEVVINCTASNDKDEYFKSLLQRHLFKIYVSK